MTREEFKKIYNIEGKDSWSDCCDLRNANGKLWHVEDLRRKRQEIIEEVQNAAENVFTRPIWRKRSKEIINPRNKHR